MTIPSGTATAQAITNPPNTRPTVTSTSFRNPNSKNSAYPAFNVAQGPARNSGFTNPLAVSAHQTATTTTNPSIPRAIRRPGDTGFSGTNKSAIKPSAPAYLTNDASTMVETSAGRRTSFASTITSLASFINFGSVSPI